MGKVDYICKLYLKPVVFSKPLKILPARGTRPNKKKCKFILVKIDSKQWKITTWSAEKYNVEQNLLRIGQAVPKAGSIFFK